MSINQTIHAISAGSKKFYHSWCDLIREEMEQDNDPIGDYFNQIGKYGLMLCVILVIMLIVLFLSI